MLLSALLLASAVHVAPPVTGDKIVSDLPASYYALMQEALDAAKARAACRNKGLEFAVDPASPPRTMVRKLGDLPPANHTLTVLRSVDGCPASSTVRFNVDLPAGR